MRTRTRTKTRRACRADRCKRGRAPPRPETLRAPPADAHVHGLEKLALNLKSWLYEWTKSGYEPL